MRFQKSVIVAADIETVFAFCNSRDGFLAQFPYKVRWTAGAADWAKGDRIAFDFRYLGFWMPYVADIVECEPPAKFVDQMVKGPYKAFRHTHTFEPVPGGTRVTDSLEFRTGLGPVIDRTVGLRMVRGIFEKRHARLTAKFGAPGERPA